MLKDFKAKFKEYSKRENLLVEMKSIPFKYSELLLDCGGVSYNKGLYNVHTFKESLSWTGFLSQYFKKYKEVIISFGHDWMGRQFCVPRNSNEHIIVFDPATQQDFYIEENLFDFHNSILANQGEEFLALETFENVLNHLGITGVDYNKCLGFKLPLFLGGNEDLSNYEVCDLEVYWDLEFQLFNQVKNMPDGTRISDVTINPFPKE